jgi:Uma2 family endonuclease
MERFRSQSETWIMATAEVELLELNNGDRMTQAEFHRIYERMPESFRAELIGGIVYVASPLKIPHGNSHMPLSTLLFTYESATPGVQSGDNVTIVLSQDSEPQPDAFLRILPDYGGQSRTDNDYVVGAPELFAEIALSSRSIDLHAKRDEYARYGGLEYLVLCVREKQLHWFDLRANQELSPDTDGVIRIRSFPGLWIHVQALLTRDARRMMATLEQGLATPEHAAFVQQLATNHAARSDRADG